MAKKKERILCAAIWYRDLPLVDREIPNLHINPVNVDRGIVFCGHRHCQCLYQMVAITGKADHEAGHGIQGFLTNLNRFVEREEGALIALARGQLRTLKYSTTLLYSEDLY